MKDTIDFLKELPSYWEKKRGLILSIIVLVFLECSFIDYNEGIRPKDYKVIHYCIIFISFFSLVLFWIFETKRFILPSSKSLKISLIINIDDSERIPTVKKIINSVIKEINRSKSYSGINITLLPINYCRSLEELNSHLENHSFSTDTVIMLKVISGNQKDVSKFIINEFNFSGYFTDTGIVKLYKHSVNIQDLKLKSMYKNWEFIDADSITDNIKLQENLKELILFYSAIYFIFQNKDENALSLLRQLFIRSDVFVKTQNINNSEKIALKPENVVAGRLCNIIVNLLLKIATNCYFDNGDLKKSIKLLREAEEIIPNHEFMPDVYLCLARYYYENNELDKSKTYTEKLRKTKAHNTLVILNDGFYSIIDGNDKRFIECYDKFLQKSIDGSIALDVCSFLDREMDKYPSSLHLFELADAILTKLYIDVDNGNELLDAFIRSNKSNQDRGGLVWLAYKTKKKKIKGVKVKVA